MSLTIVSSVTPFCSLSQMTDRYDGRTLGDLLSDDGTNHTFTGVPPVYTPSILLDPSQNPGARLYKFLKLASGEVEKACLVANRYQPSDLANLAAPVAGQTYPDGTPMYTNSGEKLADIVAGFAMFRIWDRRPARLQHVELPLSAKIALEDLDQLRDGNNILGFAEAAAAGNPQPEFMTPQEFITRNFSSVQASRYFGDRSQFHVPGTAQWPWP